MISTTFGQRRVGRTRPFQEAERTAAAATLFVMLVIALIGVVNLLAE